MAKPTEFDCANCKHRHCGDGRPGDNGPSEWQSWTMPDGSESKTCPLPTVTADSWEWLRMFRHYEKGVLAVSGGLLDQPSAYLRAMEIIGANHGKG